MKKKLYLLIASLIVATAAYAGVAYIDYSTGKFKCTDPTSSVYQLGVCQKDSGFWAGYGYCQKEAAKLCKWSD